MPVRVAAAFEAMVAEEGFERHDVPLKEKG
jgi:hypothetical protein